MYVYLWDINVNVYGISMYTYGWCIWMYMLMYIDVCRCILMDLDVYLTHLHTQIVQVQLSVNGTWAYGRCASPRECYVNRTNPHAVEVHFQNWRCKSSIFAVFIPLQPWGCSYSWWSAGFCSHHLCFIFLNLGLKQLFGGSQHEVGDRVAAVCQNANSLYFSE